MAWAPIETEEPLMGGAQGFHYRRLISERYVGNFPISWSSISRLERHVCFSGDWDEQKQIFHFPAFVTANFELIGERTSRGWIYQVGEPRNSYNDCWIVQLSAYAEQVLTLTKKQDFDNIGLTEKVRCESPYTSVMVEPHDITKDIPSGWAVKLSNDDLNVLIPSKWLH